MQLSVISPTFNEAENVPRLVEQLSQALGDIDYEILIVDDDSPDLTWSIAHKISLTNPRVRAFRRMCNPGLGAAVIDGFSEARGDALACIDADLQHDPSILPQMLAELYRGTDLVVGSRYVDGGSAENWNYVRRLESWMATKTAHFLLRVKLKDPMSGYFLVWRKDFSEVKEQLNGKGFMILLEILATVQPSSVAEVPYSFRLRTAGESKLTTKVAFQYIEQLWRLSSGRKLVPQRFLRFAAVGAGGVLINLTAMRLLLAITFLRGWRVSAMASLIANITNYIFNNYWTFADRVHKGLAVLRGYFSYLLMTGAGFVTTTAAYALLIRLSFLHNPNGQLGSIAALGCQSVAIVLGTLLNYKLSEGVIWPSDAQSVPSRVQRAGRRFASLGRLIGL